MTKRAKLEIELKVEFVQVPEDKVGTWRAGISLLLQLLYEERGIYGTEIADESVDIDRVGDVGRSIPALFSLADVAKGKRATKVGSLYAWVIGHDGAAHRMALADWRV